MRYNEMWRDWDGTNELEEPKQYVHGQLVLSWKRITVSVKQTIPKLFGRSEVTYKKILHNGKYQYYIKVFDNLSLRLTMRMKIDKPLILQLHLKMHVPL